MNLKPNNLQKLAEKVWSTTKLEEAKAGLKEMINNFAFKKKTDQLLASVEGIKNINQCHSMATNLYMQGFDDTKALGSRI